MALLLHYTGQDYISRGLLNTELTPGSTSAFADGCKTGKGFAFDGTVNSALNLNMLLSDNYFSISFWFSISENVTTSANRRCLFSTNNSTSMLFEVIENNRCRFILLGVSAVILDYNTSLVINAYYHVTIIVNNVDYITSMYINGNVVDTSTYSTPLSPSNIIYFGRRISPVQYFNGQICNFKLYNHVLSAREIAEDYKSLMLHYKLDKPITTQVTDYSGFNRHIAVIENTTTNSTTEKRVYGGSLANDGTQGLYGSLNLSELNGINEISVAVRFRFVSQGGHHCYFSSRTNVNTVGEGIALIKIGGSSRDFYVNIAGRNTFTLPNNLVSGTWYDLVAVKSTTDVKLYINGVLINTISNTNSISNMGQLYTSISRSITDANITNTNTMNGNVQDIRFYAKALTQEDVTELYQTRHMVDKDSNCYTYELIEGQSGVGMNKKGQLLCDEIIENEDGVFQIVSNKTIKTKEFKEI